MNTEAQVDFTGVSHRHVPPESGPRFIADLKSAETVARLRELQQTPPFGLAQSAITALSVILDALLADGEALLWQAYLRIPRMLGTERAFKAACEYLACHEPCVTLFPPDKNDPATSRLPTDRVFGGHEPRRV
jgi:hypothetical protein